MHVIADVCIGLTAAHANITRKMLSSCRSPFLASNSTFVPFHRDVLDKSAMNAISEEDERAPRPTSTLFLGDWNMPSESQLQNPEGRRLAAERPTLGLDTHQDVVSRPFGLHSEPYPFLVPTLKR